MLPVMTKPQAQPSMKVPPKRKGNGHALMGNLFQPAALNESPSEKEGKLDAGSGGAANPGPSMKVPPKRKGNRPRVSQPDRWRLSLNESPSEKEGKSEHCFDLEHHLTLNESPSEKEGKSIANPWPPFSCAPSMKVPPKRKGNHEVVSCSVSKSASLNESPSEKEGKFHGAREVRNALVGPSMKVPPKRKGNVTTKEAQKAALGALNESPSEKEGKLRRKI